MKPLTADQLRSFKAKAHSLKPVVMLGQKGLTPSVLAEIESSLNHHELMKIKLAVQDREERRLLAEQICQSLQAEYVGLIGQVLIVYRKSETKE